MASASASPEADPASRAKDPAVCAACAEFVLAGLGESIGDQAALAVGLMAAEE